MGRSIYPQFGSRQMGQLTENLFHKGVTCCVKISSDDASELTIDGGQFLLELLVLIALVRTPPVTVAESFNKVLQRLLAFHKLVFGRLSRDVGVGGLGFEIGSGQRAYS